MGEERREVRSWWWSSSISSSCPQVSFVGPRRERGSQKIMSAMKGLITRNLRELRFHFCQQSKGSQGLRDFVKQNYKELKTANPSFPFLVRECEGTEAKVWARYDLGVEKSLSVEGQTAKNVETSLKEFLN